MTGFVPTANGVHAPSPTVGTQTGHSPMRVPRLPVTPSLVQRDVHGGINIVARVSSTDNKWEHC